MLEMFKISFRVGESALYILLNLCLIVLILCIFEANQPH